MTLTFFNKYRLEITKQKNLLGQLEEFKEPNIYIRVVDKPEFRDDSKLKRELFIGTNPLDFMTTETVELLHYVLAGKETYAFPPRKTNA